jgi:DNA repair protein RadA/Sms
MAKLSSAKARSQHVCQSCGHIEPRWVGRCPSCAEWNSLVEEAVQPARSAATAGSARRDGGKPIALAEFLDPARGGKLAVPPRIVTGIGELDRVLGGGVVPGSLVLLGGEPGIGKSTLLLQALAEMARTRKVLYVCGEESLHQTALRAQRIGATGENLLLLAETEVERVIAEAVASKAAVLAVDSVQTLHDPAITSIPGSVGQVRECAARLYAMAKDHDLATVLVGHVTKEGSLAGPKTLEHMVDAVLAFEGERGHPCRVLRAVKNRFGSTNELGVFEMRAGGLVEVENPSAAFLAERPIGAPGSVVCSSLEGSRPLLCEVQALVATPIGNPRRAALGVDHARVSLLLAVLEQRAGVEVQTQDVFVNIAGGLRVDEPAVDLGICCAVVSSWQRRAIDAGTIVFGEVGLAGEVRAVSQCEARLTEAEKLGFTRCILPEASRVRLLAPSKLELCGVRTVAAALELALK